MDDDDNGCFDDGDCFDGGDDAERFEQMQLILDREGDADEDSEEEDEDGEDGPRSVDPFEVFDAVDATLDDQPFVAGHEDDYDIG